MKQQPLSLRHTTKKCAKTAPNTLKNHRLRPRKYQFTKTTDRTN